MAPDRRRTADGREQLCVTLLGDSRASDRSLRRSVDGILVRQQDFDPAHYKAKIATLEQERHGLGADLHRRRYRVACRRT